MGTVYVERSLVDLRERILATAAGAFVMLCISAALAFGIAREIQRLISQPIVALATAARAIGRSQRFELPPLAAPPDETGDLVRAFEDMVQRLAAYDAEREALLAREREASRLKDEFLAAVSHELRTPLNAILGWTQVLANTKPNEQTMARALSSLERNAQAQNRVIEDLLDISRVISGKLQLRLTAVDLRGVVESATEVIGPAAAAKSIRIESTVPAAPCMVQGDADRLRQIVWNLLSNAVKFTPSRGNVSIELVEAPQAFAIVVSDTGLGIAPEFLPHVFERFRQADGSMTRQHGGLGLGLAIVKELVQLQGGDVEAASGGAGRGATFTVTLPKFIGVGAEPAPSSVSISPTRLDGISVLVVDDNEDAVDVATAALSQAGARVETASSATEALERLVQARPQVIVSDLAMPGIDGFALLRRLRALDGDLAMVPVIAVTAYASAEYRERSRRAGFAAHLTKPYDTGELILAVEAAASRAFR